VLQEVYNRDRSPEVDDVEDEDEAESSMFA
jgi:hypothetical protein